MQSIYRAITCPSKPSTKHSRTCIDVVPVRSTSEYSVLGDYWSLYGYHILAGEKTLLKWRFWGEILKWQRWNERRKIITGSCWRKWGHTYGANAEWWRGKNEKRNEEVLRCDLTGLSWIWHCHRWKEKRMMLLSDWFTDYCYCKKCAKQRLGKLQYYKEWNGNERTDVNPLEVPTEFLELSISAVNKYTLCFSYLFLGPKYML